MKKIDNIQVLNPQYSKSRFKLLPIDKEHGCHLYTNTKIQSCSKIIQRNGNFVAIPRYIKSNKQEKQDYIETILPSPYNKQLIHATSSKKPLVKYDPNHVRNRLIIQIRQPKREALNLLNDNYKRYKTVQSSMIGNFQDLKQQRRILQLSKLKRKLHKYRASLPDRDFF